MTPMRRLTVNTSRAPAAERATYSTSGSAMRVGARLFSMANSGLARPAAPARLVTSRLILTAWSVRVATLDVSRQLPPLPTLRGDLANDWIGIQHLRFHD